MLTSTLDVPPTPPGFRILSLPVLSWAFYDFANTIFSFAVITRYFNEWVIDDLGRPDWNLGLMSFLVGLVLVVAMPALGAISDQLGRRVPFLAVFTLLCVVSTAGLAVVDGATFALILGGTAIFFYQLALSMYDPLLPVVAPEERRGTVSGLGVGLGYLGALVGALVLLKVVGSGDAANQQDAFLPTAIMFAVFAIPLLLFVRERPHPHGDLGAVRPGSRALVHGALTQVVQTVGHIRRDHGDVGRFLVARFLYVDAIATVIAVMTIYMSRVGEFSEGTKTTILGLAMICAALGAFASGRLVEAWGPKRVLVGILTIAAITLATAGVSGSSSLVWLLGPLVGISLGAVWTSDRVLMLRLSPPAVRGEFFGIYNLVGKLSSGFGPLVLWGGTIWILHGRSDALSVLDASRVALVLLAAAIVAGITVLRPLSDVRRFPDEEWSVGKLPASPPTSSGGH